ncbi:MAG: hypothetical protein RSE64_08220 [Oscillospiraceae bacterium]
MADKQAIINDVRKNYGNMLSIQKATEALGFKDRRAAVRFLSDVPVCNMGKEKKYLAIDVGRKIFDMMEA